MRFTGRTVDGTEKSQIDKFRDAARDLETDDSEERFDRIIKGIAKAPAKPAEGEKPKE